MKKEGASIILVNRSEQVLLCLRDDKPDIPYPNCWDLLGGAVEAGETPRECILRELREEIEVSLDGPQLFNVYDMDDRLEYTFWKLVDFDVRALKLNEGQELRWFTESEVESLHSDAIAFNFRCVILEFFDKRPWLAPTTFPPRT